MPPEFVQHMPNCFGNVQDLEQFPEAPLLFILQEKQVGFGAFRCCLKHFTKVGLTSLSLQWQVRRQRGCVINKYNLFMCMNCLFWPWSQGFWTSAVQEESMVVFFH